MPSDGSAPGNFESLETPAGEPRPVWAPRWTGRDWHIAFRVPGKRIRECLGIRARDAEDIAKAVAWQRYTKEIKQANGLIPSPTFAEGALLYMKGTNNTRYLDRIIECFGPYIRCDEIDHVAMLRVGAKLSSNWNAATLRRQVYTPIKAVLSFINGTHKARNKVHGGARERWLTPEEFERLIKVASEPETAGVRDPERYILKVIVYMVGTGCGPAETYSVNVEDFNWATNEVLIRESKTTARTRWVRMPKRAVELIGELPTSGRAFLAPNGKPFPIYDHAGGQLSKQFRKLCRAAGLDDKVVMYTLRHTWATWYSAQVGDHDLLLDRGGWKKSDTARIYRKRAPADLANRLLEHGWDFRERFDG